MDHQPSSTISRFRHPDDEILLVPVQFRVSPGDAQSFDAMADKYHISRPELFRRMIRDITGLAIGREPERRQVAVPGAVPRKPERPEVIDSELVVGMWNSRRNARQIAEDLGISYEMVLNLIYGDGQV